MVTSKLPSSSLLSSPHRHPELSPYSSSLLITKVIGTKVVNALSSCRCYDYGLVLFCPTFILFVLQRLHSSGDNALGYDGDDRGFDSRYGKILLLIASMATG